MKEGKKLTEVASVIAAGRKYRMAIICLLLILGGFFLAGWNPAFIPILSDLITGVLGVQAIYSGLNVANKFVTTKKEQG